MGRVKETHRGGRNSQRQLLGRVGHGREQGYQNQTNAVAVKRGHNGLR